MERSGIYGEKRSTFESPAGTTLFVAAYSSVIPAGFWRGGESCPQAKAYG
ncbi:MAG: hypothetical protein LBQ70_07625 [Prevotellaceae bacterium]|nr:hypothetical protein [Prevotellaceae bacterium]